MTKEEIKALAAESAREAVRQVFTTLGTDIDSAEDIGRLHANMAWVCRFRRTSEKVGATIILAVITTITGGVVTVFWDNLVKMIRGH